MGDLFNLESKTAPAGPVECLGITFPNDDARRKYFLQKLREKLRDPEFRKIDGFPVGTDEDILAMSDPPYYTACPNPFLADFIKQYGKSYEPSKPYSSEPFAADVSEGKNEPIYNVHAYTTKVPPGAIEPLIAHYLASDDCIILDPFAGTGMTGVAVARSNRNAYGILQDLSPAAAHIAATIQSEITSPIFREHSEAILNDVEREFGWFYSTMIEGVESQVRYYVWSDIYACDACSQPVKIWDIEGRQSVGGLKEKVPCPHCGSLISKQCMEPITETYFDHVLGSKNVRIKSTPVLKVINKGHRSHKLSVDDGDLELLRKINAQTIPFAVPTAKMLFKEGCWGDQWRSSYHLGVTHAHHFYTYRNFWILCAIWNRIQEVPAYSIKRLLQFWFTASLSRVTRLNRYMAQHDRHVGPLAGTLFIGPIQAEISPFYFFREKIEDVIAALSQSSACVEPRNFVSASSSTKLLLPDNSVDHIFTDPPFGDNLMYSELNFLLEAWLNIFTNQRNEAVISESQGKNLRDFETLMGRVFAECYRVLKPGRWMIVEFHNSRNTVWAAIQEALSVSGFVIADVRTLDKQKGTTKQLTQSGTVKQDLIITAYKPNGGLEERFKLEAGTENGVWDFIRTHLKQLPIFVSKGDQSEVIAERQNYLLFDRMVAFHVQRGVTVPLSATEFYTGLAQRFSERDGMYFLPEQVAEYDKKRLTVREVLQLQLFVTDESSAIQWLKQQLMKKPQTFQELHPQFLKEIGGWQKYEKPLELSDLLEQNFLGFDGKGPIPPQIVSWIKQSEPLRKQIQEEIKAGEATEEMIGLATSNSHLLNLAKGRWYIPDPNQAGDLEKLRERALFKEFWTYLPPGYQPVKAAGQAGFLSGLTPGVQSIPKGKRLKIIRLEAVRAGFKLCWQNRDYRTIIAVAQRIPESVLQEDPKLLMWFDQAMTRTGVDA